MVPLTSTQRPCGAGGRKEAVVPLGGLLRGKTGGEGRGGDEAAAELVAPAGGRCRPGPELLVLLLHGIELASEGVVSLWRAFAPNRRALVEQGAAGLDLEGLAGEGVTGGDELRIVLHGGGWYLRRAAVAFRNWRGRGPERRRGAAECAWRNCDAAWMGLFRGMFSQSGNARRFPVTQKRTPRGVPSG